LPTASLFILPEKVVGVVGSRRNKCPTPESGLDTCGEKGASLHKLARRSGPVLSYFLRGMQPRSCRGQCTKHLAPENKMREREREREREVDSLASRDLVKVHFYKATNKIDERFYFRAEKS